MPTERLFRVWLEQPNVSLDLLLISSRPFHHKPAVSESRRALLQPVVETKIKCRWRQNFQAALLSQDSIYSSILRSGNSFSFSKTPKSNKLYSGSRAERLVRAFRGFGDFVARRFKALDLCDPMRVCSAQFFNVSLEFEKTRDLRFTRQIYLLMRTRLLRPSDPQSQLGKMPALCGNLFEMPVEGTGHEAYF